MVFAFANSRAAPDHLAEQNLTLCGAQNIHTVNARLVPPRRKKRGVADYAPVGTDRGTVVAVNVYGV